MGWTGPWLLPGLLASDRTNGGDLDHGKCPRNVHKMSGKLFSRGRCFDCSSFRIFIALGQTQSPKLWARLRAQSASRGLYMCRIHVPYTCAYAMYIRSCTYPYQTRLHMHMQTYGKHRGIFEDTYNTYMDV